MDEDPLYVELKRVSYLFQRRLYIQYVKCLILWIYGLWATGPAFRRGGVAAQRYQPSRWLPAPQLEIIDPIMVIDAQPAGPFID